MCDPKEVAALVGMPFPAFQGKKGDLRVPGRGLTFSESFITYQVSMDVDSPMQGRIPALLSALGGVERIRTIINQVQPDYVGVELYLPVKNSPRQDTGFVAAETIDDLAVLGAELVIGIC
jgi:hypothetical protein